MNSKLLPLISALILLAGCESTKPIDDTPKTERKTSFGQAVDKAEKLSKDTDLRNSEVAAQAHLIDDQDLEED